MNLQQEARDKLRTWRMGARAGRWNCSSEEQLKVLSLREREVYEYLVRGCTILELNALLKISVNTVKQHRKSVFKKLDVHSQVELMRYYGTMLGVE